MFDDDNVTMVTSEDILKLSGGGQSNWRSRMFGRFDGPLNQSVLVNH